MDGEENKIIIGKKNLIAYYLQQLKHAYDAKDRKMYYLEFLSAICTHN
jgi:hypothetical protein